MLDCWPIANSTTPEPIKVWPPTSLKEKLMKIGAKIVSHGRYCEKSLHRHTAADRGPAATARSITSVIGSIVMSFNENQGRVRPDAGEMDVRGAERSHIIGFGAWPPPWPRPGLAKTSRMAQYWLLRVGHRADDGIWHASCFCPAVCAPKEYRR